jgi:hypothetical protein
VSQSAKDQPKIFPSGQIIGEKLQVFLGAKKNTAI